MADAFGGKLAVIDLAAREILSLHRMDAHNLRGLTVNAATNELAVAHQALIQHLSTTRDHIFWGNIVGNFVKSIPLEFNRVPGSDQREGPETSKIRGSQDNEKPGFREKSGFRRIAHWSLDALGGPGKAAGDPGKIVFTNDGKTIVALSGVDQIALRSGPNKPFAYLPVGARPVALALSSDQKSCYVANAFDDTISIVNLEMGEVAATIPLGPRRELSAAEEGERFFYNARPSLHGWYSCHSCHPDGHTIGLLNDNLGDDAYGDPKRIPSLLGVSNTAPWGWTGGKKFLADQIRGSLLNTMHGGDAPVRRELPTVRRGSPDPADRPTAGLPNARGDLRSGPVARSGDRPQQDAGDETVTALEAYLRTLAAPPSIGAARGMLASDAVERGRKVFDSRGCATCHVPPHYTSTGTYDVGIHDKSGQTNFNPPSLRGLIHRGPFLHDNRAATLRDLFTRFHHGDTDDISPRDLDDLLEFLAGL